MTDSRQDDTEIPDPPSIPIGLAEVQNDATSLSCQFSMISDIGQVRETNEDSASAMALAQVSHQGGQPCGVFILADGMGGHEAGERASLAAVQVSSESLLREVISPLIDPANEMRHSVPINEAIERAFEEAHARVLQEVSGGATTLTIVLLMGRRIYVGHAGDCRLYLFHDRDLTLLTRDHSILNRLVELGQIDAHEVASLTDDPRRNALYRAVGQVGEVELDFFSRSVEPDSGLLLCSDGLWGSVPDEVMLDIILGADSPATACRDLVDAANEVGGPDNITAILVHPIG